jgi:hypothetical protein
VKTVRELSVAGPCITLGLVLRETDRRISYRDRPRFPYTPPRRAWWSWMRVSEPSSMTKGFSVWKWEVFFCPLRFPTTSARRHPEKSRRKKSCPSISLYPPKARLAVVDAGLGTIGGLGRSRRHTRLGCDGFVRLCAQSAARLSR